MPPDRTMPAPGLSHAQIADHNSRTILEALRRNGPMTRLELATLTGLTAPGVTNVLRRHLAEGLIVQGHRRTQNAQVPSAEFKLRPEGAHAIGLRFRRDRLEAILINLAGAVRARARLARDGSDERAVRAVLDRLVAADAPSNLIGIGVALDEYGGETLETMRRAVPEYLVAGELDTVAAVLAERTLGPSVPDTGMVVVLIEERVRAGLFLHSIPFAGARGRAGRIGGMRSGRDRLPLDQVCSTAAFNATVDAAGKGDLQGAGFERWVAEAGEHLFDALMAIAGFVAPGKIVLDGDLPPSVVEALIAGLQDVRESQRPDSPPPPLPPVVPAAFPGDSVLLGAALLPFFEVLLPKPSTGN